jgi:hypothetical protein
MTIDEDASQDPDPSVLSSLRSRGDAHAPRDATYDEARRICMLPIANPPTAPASYPTRCILFGDLL